MKKDKKKASYVFYAIILIIFGIGLLSVGYYVYRNIGDLESNLTEVTAHISSYENVNDDKVNVICKYGYEGNEYSYTCYTTNKAKAEEDYKIGTEKTIKISKSDPGKIIIFNLIYVVIFVTIIGVLLLLISVIYLFKEIIRLSRNLRES